jgi:hypothetical protein
MRTCDPHSWGSARPLCLSLYSALCFSNRWCATASQANTGQWNGLIVLINSYRRLEYDYLLSSGLRPDIGKFVEAHGVRCALPASFRQLLVYFIWITTNETYSDRILCCMLDWEIYSCIFYLIIWNIDRIPLHITAAHNAGSLHISNLIDKRCSTLWRAQDEAFRLAIGGQSGSESFSYNIARSCLHISHFIFHISYVHPVLSS